MVIAKSHKRITTIEKQENHYPMPNFSENSNAVIIGASGGIGNAFLHHLQNEAIFKTIYAVSRQNIQTNTSSPKGLSYITLENFDEPSLNNAAINIKSQTKDLHCVFIATGILHEQNLKPEKQYRQINQGSLSHLFNVNAILPILAAKAFAPLMSKTEPAVIAAISARVGSIDDNRTGGWYSYRASKSALNMLFKTFAIEMKRVNPNLIVSLLHPGTTNTGLSKPYQANVPAEKLFSPKQSANYLYRVIKDLRHEDSGSFNAWDGQPINW